MLSLVYFENRYLESFNFISTKLHIQQVLKKKFDKTLLHRLNKAELKARKLEKRQSVC